MVVDVELLAARAVREAQELARVFRALAEAVKS